MGAMASVNHLHFQFWRTDSNRLPIEILEETLRRQQVGVLQSGRDVTVREIVGYPVHGFIYARNADEIADSIGNGDIGLSVDMFTDPLWHCIEYLIAHNVPHTLLMNRQRIFLFVRREETPSEYPIFYGFSDVSGWITLLDPDVFDTITPEQLWHDMSTRISIGDEQWQRVKAHCKSIE